MPRESSDLRPPGYAELPPDVRAQFDLIVAPFERVSAELDELRAENAQHLAAEARAGLDPEIEQALDRAARQPGAPHVLTRMAHKISLGQLSWSDVFGPGADLHNPDVADLRTVTFDTAREAFEHSDWDVEIVPEPPGTPEV